MKKIEILGCDSELRHALDFIQKELESPKFNKRIANESMLLYEETLINVFKYVPDDQYIEIKFINNLGKYTIKITFPGDEYLIKESNSEITKSILNYFDDRINIRYINGLNTLTIGVKEASNLQTMRCFIAVFLSFGTYLILNSVLDSSQLLYLKDNILEPFCKIFFNIFLMLSAPVTFVNVVANFIRGSNVADRKISVGALLGRFFLSSIGALLVAYITHIITKPYIRQLIIAPKVDTLVQAGFSFKSFIEKLVPENIIEPFTSNSPLPILFFAFIMGLALCNMQRGRTKIRSFVFGVENFMEKLLSIAFSCLPLAVFLAVFIKLISNFNDTLRYSLVLFTVFTIGSVLLIIAYAIFLICSKVNPFTFFREYIDVLREDAKIGSTCDAITYNIRAYANKIKAPKDYLAYVTQLNAYINQDGVSFVLLLGTLTKLCVNVPEIPISAVILIAFIAFILSLGAPAQAGSIIIGFVIMSQLMGTWNTDTLYWVIIFEAFLGRLATQINIFGGVVAVVTHSKEYLRKKDKK